MCVLVYYYRAFITCVRRCTYAPAPAYSNAGTLCTFPGSASNSNRCSLRHLCSFPSTNVPYLYLAAADGLRLKIRKSTMASRLSSRILPLLKTQNLQQLTLYKAVKFLFKSEFRISVTYAPWMLFDCVKIHAARSKKNLPRQGEFNLINVLIWDVCPFLYFLGVLCYRLRV